MNRSARGEQLESLRNIEPQQILRAVGAKPDPHDSAKWRTERGVLTINGAKFFNWNENAGGGGAIDLAMHLKSIPFKQAVEWLKEHCINQPTTISSITAHVGRTLRLPLPLTPPLPTVLRYLEQQRRLPKQALLELAASGDLYADRKLNAVFVMRNRVRAPVGAELRGTGTIPWRGMAAGSNKNHGCFAIGPRRPNAFVLCESAIDAISCHTIRPQCRCISTAGARVNPSWLPQILESNIPVYCGFDNDPTGNAMADAMIEQYPVIQRLRPAKHDWNDALTANP